MLQKNKQQTIHTPLWNHDLKQQDTEPVAHFAWIHLQL